MVLWSEGLDFTITLDAWRQSGFWLSFRGMRLFVVEYGQGIPVLALHAFPTGSYDYSRIVPLLQDRFRLILFDFPGFGFSDKPSRFAYSLFTYADAAQAVAAHFGLEHLCVLGHDIGDSVALELLRRGSPVIERLVLMNGSVYSIPFTDFKMRLLQKLFLNPHTGAMITRLRLIRRETFPRMFNPIFAHPLTQAELDMFWSLVAYHDGARLYPRLMWYMLERWEHQQTWLNVLRNHPAPLTLIWGQSDPVATPEVADTVMKLRPDAQVVRLEQVGHYPHWEAPEVTVEAVRSAFI